MGDLAPNDTEISVSVAANGTRNSAPTALNGIKPDTTAHSAPHGVESRARAVPDWVRQLPKVELHAHLSGSVRDDVLRKLLQRPQHAATRAQHEAVLLQPRTLRACFSIFPLLHALIDDSSALRECVRSVLTDFESDSAVYLELRTTPRASAGLTAREYVDVVLHEVSAYHRAHPNGLTCRILLSVDRSRSVTDAWSTVALARDLLALPATDARSGLVVGIELSGNPNQGIWATFLPVFTHIRANLCLPISLHFAEVDNEDEALAMLDFAPDRVGHAAVLSERVRQRLLASRVPVEVCITSNLLTGLANSAAEHLVVTSFIPAAHPFSVCTDDCGIFRTSLSEEVAMLVEESGVGVHEMGKLVLAMIDQAFCRDFEVMANVRRRAVDQIYRVMHGE